MSERVVACCDVDGTLLDTKEFILQAYEYTLAEFGCDPCTREILSTMMGKPLKECYGILAPDQNVDCLVEAHRLFQDQNLHLAVPFSNTLSSLEDIKSKGGLIAAVTTRSSRNSIKTLELTRVLPFMDTVVSGEDVSFPKPHPEPVLKALSNLDLSGENAFMIGDTIEDVNCGKAAGVATIGVT